MKRHPSLAHLSRDHHGALLLARLLQKNAPAYNGLPTDVAGKAAYALKQYTEELVPHFIAEEQIFKWVIGINGQLDLLVQTIHREHQELHQLFSNFPDGPDLESYLDATGKALETHIRKEEREVFPLMQECCDDAMMDKINHYLSSQED
ncbi:MAG: hemerythrin domain-containing protein [Ferruginibacter sp.]